MDDLARPSVERASEIPLHVLARGQDDELLAAARVRGSDARVQIDVGFVGVEDLVLGVGPLHQPIDLAKDSAATSDRDAQPHSWPTAAYVVRAQQVANVARAQPHARVLDELGSEQFQRPGRALPAEVLRRGVDVTYELGLDLGGNFARRSVRAPVESPSSPRSSNR